MKEKHLEFILGLILITLTVIMLCLFRLLSKINNLI